MKLYSVKKGTDAVVFKILEKTKLGSSNGHLIRWSSGQDYVTSKDLAFFDTVVDPIRVANKNVSGVAQIFVTMANYGYSVFVNPDTPDWAIAVPFSKVKVQ